MYVNGCAVKINSFDISWHNHRHWRGMLTKLQIYASTSIKFITFSCGVCACTCVCVCVTSFTHHRNLATGTHNSNTKSHKMNWNYSWELTVFSWINTNNFRHRTTTDVINSLNFDIIEFVEIFSWYKMYVLGGSKLMLEKTVSLLVNKTKIVLHQEADLDFYTV